MAMIRGGKLKQEIDLSLNNITFEQIEDNISFQFIHDNLVGKNTIIFYLSFLIIIGLEIFLSIGLTGLFIFKPLFAVIAWGVTITTIVMVIKLNVRTWSKKYLKTFHRRLCIVFLMRSIILFLSTYIIFLAFSYEKFSSTYIPQITIQVIISIVIGFSLELFIVKYISYRKKKELFQLGAEIAVPKWGVRIEKSAGYGVVILLISMQFYRLNKFWIELDETGLSNILIPLIQLVLGIMLVILVITLSLMICYPEFIKNQLLEKFSEEFRIKYEFTEREWYEE